MDRTRRRLKRGTTMSTVDSPAKFTKSLQQMVDSTSTPLLPRTSSKTEYDLRQDSGFTELSACWSQTDDTSSGDKDEGHESSLSQLTESSSEKCGECSTTSDENSQKSGLQQMLLHYDKLNKICPAEKRIGRRIGEEFIDMVGELSTLQIPALSKIFSYLDNKDVLSCAKVSQCWLAALHQNSSTSKRLTKLIKKENCLPKKEESASHKTGAPLASIEINSNISPSSSNSSTPEDWYSENPQFYRFTKEAKKLKSGQRFVKCTHCSGPAKLYREARRATCTDKECKFDFCTLCELDYHGASNCLTSPSKKSKAKENPISSKASRRILKRL